MVSLSAGISVLGKTSVAIMVPARNSIASKSFQVMGCSVICFPSLRLSLLRLIDNSLFHDEGDLLHQTDIGQGIARHGNEVGDLSGLDGTEIVLNTE